MIIGLTGTLAAGKGTVAEFFKNKGFAYLSLSDELRNIVIQRGLNPTRQILNEFGCSLRKEKGKGILAELIKEKIIQNNYKNVVVDGLRNPAEVEVIKKLSNFFLIAVDAPARIRFERMKKRNRENDPKSWEDFLKLDEMDKGIDSDEFGPFVSKCIQEADFLVINSGSFDELEKKLENIYTKILARSL